MCWECQCCLADGLWKVLGVPDVLVVVVRVVVVRAVVLVVVVGGVQGACKCGLSFLIFPCHGRCLRRSRE